MQSFDSYYAKSLVQGAMIKIKTKVLNAPKGKFRIMPPRSSANEKTWADEELAAVLKKWGDRPGTDQLTDIFWSAFDKDIKNNRYI